MWTVHSTAFASQNCPRRWTFAAIIENPEIQIEVHLVLSHPASEMKMSSTVRLLGLASHEPNSRVQEEAKKNGETRVKHLEAHQAGGAANLN